MPMQAIDRGVTVAQLNTFREAFEELTDEVAAHRDSVPLKLYSLSLCMRELLDGLCPRQHGLNPIRSSLESRLDLFVGNLESHEALPESARIDARLLGTFFRNLLHEIPVS